MAISVARNGELRGSKSFKVKNFAGPLVLAATIGVMGYGLSSHPLSWQSAPIVPHAKIAAPATVNSRDDFLAFTKLVVTLATRQGVQPKKTCDQNGCETSYVTKIADDFVRVDTETYNGKRDVVVFCKGNANDSPYRMCGNSEGQIYREKLINGEFRLETVQRMNWPHSPS